MTDFLTTKQLQELLQIDRTTVYRMLKDGRLTGVKIGGQWRFPRENVEALLAGAVNPEESQPSLDSAITPEVIPTACVQPIQDVFAEILGVGAITTRPDGQPLTNISNSCRFCNLILNSEAGYQGCVKSWRRLAIQSEHRPRFVTCHAGLQYARARIEIHGKLNSMLIAGQFYATPPDAEEEQARIAHLAQTYGIDEQALQEAAAALPVLGQPKLDRIGYWLERVAHSFGQISTERANFLRRLRQIALMSTLDFEKEEESL